MRSLLAGLAGRALRNGAMSRTTVTFHVRGVRRARVLEVIAGRMRGLGLCWVPEPERARVEKTDPTVRRMVLARRGRWLTLVDTAPCAWGDYLSRDLGRSVLELRTWDGEASVTVTRWKQGKVVAQLELLDEAYRKGTEVYAPARVLLAWLPPERREAVLREGIKLVVPSGGPTGDAEIDAQLEAFDESDGDLDEDGGHFVPQDVTVEAIATAIGLTFPFPDPWVPRRVGELLFRHTGTTQRDKGQTATGRFPRARLPR